MSPLPRKVLVVGSGGREHALARAIGASCHAPQVLVAPGNAGIAVEFPCLPASVDNVAGLVKLAQIEGIDLAVIGPELPLSLGLADQLRAAGIPTYGPGANGARLEASKIFTKRVLQKYGIPTAASAEFSTVEPAIAYLRSRPAPIVVKADGLAAGKGVIVATTTAEAEAAVHDMLEGGKFGASGRHVLIEDCLVGEETSIHVIVSGRDYLILPTAQDHKRIGDGDTGPNTGGMGAYSPAEVVTPALLERIEREIVRPSVDGIAAEGIDFRGTLFIGIMLTPEGPQVLEFNTRFGDPETQVILPRIASDMLEMLHAAAHGSLAEYKLETRPEYALCVVVAARGYPDSYARGEPIRLPDSLPEQTHIIHAGTATSHSGGLVSSGGRVLGAVSLASTLREAADHAYAACDALDYAHKYFRRDIGARQLHRQQG